MGGKPPLIHFLLGLNAAIFYNIYSLNNSRIWCKNRIVNPSIQE